MPITPVATVCVLRLDHPAFARDLRATVDALLADGLTVQVHELGACGAVLECFEVAGRELGRAQAYGIVPDHEGIHADPDDPGAEADEGCELGLSLDEELAMLCAVRVNALRRGDARLAESMGCAVVGRVLAARAAS